MFFDFLPPFLNRFLHSSKILVDFLLDDCHFGIHWFIMAAHESGEGHCQLDSVSGDLLWFGHFCHHVAPVNWWFSLVLLKTREASKQLHHCHIIKIMIQFLLAISVASCICPYTLCCWQSLSCDVFSACKNNYMWKLMLQVELIWIWALDSKHRKSSGVRHNPVGVACSVKFNLVMLNLKKIRRNLLHF